ncbi:MAG: endolytic transglycosylase MltG, partial [Chitinophagaceae bacterium]|nr:endolytic transglycosylase MltG [Chitinophagaceae bacterium]
DPTVKFALRNFGLKRIYEKHLAIESPYNTYRNKGLPPGPICTPSLATIDAVLNSPKTDYMFFVAKKDFTQGHIFTSTYQEHLKYAKEYRQALNLQEQIKQKAQEETGND